MINLQKVENNPFYGESLINRINVPSAKRGEQPFIGQ